MGLKAVCSKPFSSPSIDFISSRAFRRTSFNLSWILFDWRAPQFYIYIPLFQNTKCCHGWRGLTCYINSLARCDLHDNLHIVRNRGIRQPGPKPINHLPELFSVPGSIRTHNWDFPFIFWISSIFFCQFLRLSSVEVIDLLHIYLSGTYIPKIPLTQPPTDPRNFWFPGRPEPRLDVASNQQKVFSVFNNSHRPHFSSTARCVTGAVQ